MVEFIEIDPRPRHKSDVDVQQLPREDHKSGIAIDWTDHIADRFKNPLDAELVTDIPGWTARVKARLEANLRPLDGVPAVQLKSWLEGAGYWDVTQNIIRLPVGGETIAGELLKEYLLCQLTVENAIDKVSLIPKDVIVAELPSFAKSCQKSISGTSTMANTISICTLSLDGSQKIHDPETCLRMALDRR